MTVLTSVEQTVSNISASIAMENMPLTNEDKTRIKDFLENRISYKEAYNQILKKHGLIGANGK